MAKGSASYTTSVPGVTGYDTARQDACTWRGGYTPRRPMFSRCAPSACRTRVRIHPEGDGID